MNSKYSIRQNRVQCSTEVYSMYIKNMGGGFAVCAILGP